MGLLDKLKTIGSIFSVANGNSIPVNPLATKSSKMHADGSNPGYSLTGANKGEVSAEYLAYDNGKQSPLPPPSRLDLNGKTPKKYSDNLPK